MDQRRDMNAKDIRDQFDLIARQYDEDRKCFIPCFDDYYVRSVSLLKDIKRDAVNITDLGAGTGLLTKELYLLYPDAHFTLVDLSTDMLEVAKQRFSGLVNFDFRVEDYFNGIKKGSDILCSALSIHHLEDDEKQKLYQSIYESLPLGGVFINLDQFCSDSIIIDKAYNDWWMNYIDHSGIIPEAKAKWLERKKLDRENSVSSTLTMLKTAGFKHVECVYEFMKFGTVIAIKE
ncbi:MAG: class I SAM-dependent methyltransferase [Prevotella sp.]|jgi:ubiquinone/menaquinone biosynthesis C-methylase UbiE|nr:class I SAM-dependent methyltransferase [Prevotella sp.]